MKKIMEITKDPTLSDAEKAIERQNLMSGKWKQAPSSEDATDAKSERAGDRRAVGRRAAAAAACVSRRSPRRRPPRLTALPAPPSASAADDKGKSAAGEKKDCSLLDDDTLKCAICFDLCVRPVTVRCLGATCARGAGLGRPKNASQSADGSADLEVLRVCRLRSPHAAKRRSMCADSKRQLGRWCRCCRADCNTPPFHAAGCPPPHPCLPAGPLPAQLLPQVLPGVICRAAARSAGSLWPTQAPLQRCRAGARCSALLLMRLPPPPRLLHAAHAAAAAASARPGHPALLAFHPACSSNRTW